MSDAIPLSGLARQMVLTGLLDEKTAQQAQQHCQRNKTSLVTYLVQNRLAKGRAVAELAAEQFGIAFLDLNAVDPSTQPRDLVSEKLLRKHRVLPLARRGNKLFVRNRGYADGQPHKTLLQVFDLLGNDHPLVTLYRRKLYQAIY